MKPLTSISFKIREKGSQKPPPVKLEFKGRNGTSDPFLGSSKRLRVPTIFIMPLIKILLTLLFLPEIIC
jgi:hypothetical protein